jgi:hypothetical protein
MQAHGRQGQGAAGQVAQNRVAYSPAEFSRLFGHHPSWSYRLLYSGRVRAVSNLGRLLIPATEISRLLESAGLYDPQPNDKQKVEQIE